MEKMKTIFDKIYVLSLITNKDRQEFIKYQFNKIGLDFEFIYGTDFYNIKNNAKNIKINYPDVWKLPVNYGESAKNFGCALSHYNAVLYAYEFGYNNVLIIEDDIMFIKNEAIIKYYLNNIPKDADFITFDPRFETTDKQNEFIDELKTNHGYWHSINSKFNIIGGMLYGLMNRKTMELYLTNQRKAFNMSDHVNNIFEDSILKRYASTKCICADQYNILNNFCTSYTWYDNIYKKIYKFNPNNFYNIDKYSYDVLFTRL